MRVRDEVVQLSRNQNMKEIKNELGVINYG